jgi:hypothetical protein
MAFKHMKKHCISLKIRKAQLKTTFAKMQIACPIGENVGKLLSLIANGNTK